MKWTRATRSASVSAELPLFFNHHLRGKRPAKALHSHIKREKLPASATAAQALALAHPHQLAYQSIPKHVRDSEAEPFSHSCPQLQLKGRKKHRNNQRQKHRQKQVQRKRPPAQARAPRKHPLTHLTPAGLQRQLRHHPLSWYTCLYWPFFPCPWHHFRPSFCCIPNVLLRLLFATSSDSENTVRFRGRTLRLCLSSLYAAV